MKKNNLLFLLINLFPFLLMGKAPSLSSVDILFFSAINPDMTEAKIEEILKAKKIDAIEIARVVQIQKCIRKECEKLNETLNESLSYQKQLDTNHIRAFYSSLGIPNEQIDIILASLNSGVALNASCNRSSPLMRTTLVDRCLLFEN